MSEHSIVEGVQLSPHQRRACLDLLVSAFARDPGVCTLWGAPELPVDELALRHWFDALLGLLGGRAQSIMALSLDGQIKGVAITSSSLQKPNSWRFLLWCITVVRRCGKGVVMQTGLHDQRRSKFLPRQHHMIIEFICVDEMARGRGLGKILFEAVHRIGKTTNSIMWLETTKQENIPIFERFGYTLAQEYEDLGVTNYTMIKRSD